MTSIRDKLCEEDPILNGEPIAFNTAKIDKLYVDSSSNAITSRGWL
jgi:hypothetical protein